MLQGVCDRRCALLGALAIVGGCDTRCRMIPYNVAELADRRPGKDMLGSHLGKAGIARDLADFLGPFPLGVPRCCNRLGDRLLIGSAKVSCPFLRTDRRPRICRNGDRRDFERFPIDDAPDRD